MPSCFSLTKKGEDKPTPLSKIDEELCVHFNHAVHPVTYLWGWYDAIGFNLAIGKSFPEVREHFQKMLLTDEIKNDEQSILLVERWISMVGYLEDHYTSDSWKEWK